MYNEELAKIPIGRLLSSNGIVAVWCTNAPSHLRSISDEMFPAWGVTYQAKWFWVKVKEAIQFSSCSPIVKKSFKQKRKSIYLFFFHPGHQLGRNYL